MSQKTPPPRPPRKDRPEDRERYLLNASKGGRYNPTKQRPNTTIPHSLPPKRPVRPLFNSNPNLNGDTKRNTISPNSHKEKTPFRRLAQVGKRFSSGNFDNNKRNSDENSKKSPSDDQTKKNTQTLPKKKSKPPTVPSKAFRPNNFSGSTIGVVQNRTAQYNSLGSKDRSASIIQGKHSGKVLRRNESLAAGLGFGDSFISDLIKALRKFSGANTQLIAVSKSISNELQQSLSKKASKKDKNNNPLLPLDSQLVLAVENLDSANAKMKMDINDTMKRSSAEAVNKLIVSMGVLAGSSSFLVNCCKAVTLALGNISTFPKILTATRTMRQAATLCHTQLKKAPQIYQNHVVEKQLSQAMKTVEQSVLQIVVQKAGLLGENFISRCCKQEIIGAVVAAVVATTKLARLRSNRQTGEKIIAAAKVAATTISQLNSALSDAANNDILLAFPNYQNLLTNCATSVQTVFGDLMEETKQSLGRETKANSPAYSRIKEELSAVVAAVDLLAGQSLKKENPPPCPSEANQKFGAEVVQKAIPEALPKPPADSSANSDGESASASVNIWDEPPDNESNIRYKGSKIKCATLNKLIEKLTASSGSDMNMTKTFATTYRSFTTPHELISKLIERYHIPPQHADNALPVQLRVCNMLRVWVEIHLNDINDSEVRVLDNFVKELDRSPKYQKYAEKILKMIESRNLSDVDTVKRHLELKLEPKIPLSPSRFLSVFDDVQIARQLTMVEFQIYAIIRPEELLHQAWNKDKLKYRAPNVRRLIKRSTALSMWIASNILWQPTLKERVRVLTKLINIALHLRKLNNFNALMAFIAGINNASIYRLKHTRAGVPASTMAAFHELETLMSSDGSFLNYRTALHNVNPPCVPFLGVYLTDLTFGDDANKDYIDGLINFTKWELMYGIIGEIQQYQQQAYDFEEVDHVASFLSELPHNNDDDLWALSRYSEPKGKPKEELL